MAAEGPRPLGDFQRVAEVAVAAIVMPRQRTRSLQIALEAVVVPEHRVEEMLQRSSQAFPERPARATRGLSRTQAWGTVSKGFRLASGRSSFTSRAIRIARVLVGRPSQRIDTRLPAVSRLSGWRHSHSTRPARS
jgi:hypothetical protein